MERQSDFTPDAEPDSRGETAVSMHFGARERRGEWEVRMQRIKLRSTHVSWELPTHEIV